MRIRGAPGSRSPAPAMCSRWPGSGQICLLCSRTRAWGWRQGDWLVAQPCPKVCLETSWCGILDTAMLAEMVGPDRLMPGSDGAQDPGAEIAKHHALWLSPGGLSHCPGGTAAKVFRL